MSWWKVSFWYAFFPVHIFLLLKSEFDEYLITFCHLHFLRSLNSLVHSSRKLTLRLLDFISKHQVTFTILPWEYVTIFLLGNLPFHIADEGRAIRAKYSILYFRSSHHFHSVSAFLSRLRELNKLACSQYMGLHSSVSRALQCWRRVHGLESRRSPEIFSG